MMLEDWYDDLNFLHSLEVDGEDSLRALQAHWDFLDARDARRNWEAYEAHLEELRLLEEEREAEREAFGEAFEAQFLGTPPDPKPYTRHDRDRRSYKGSKWAKYDHLLDECGCRVIRYPNGKTKRIPRGASVSIRLTRDRKHMNRERGY